MTDPDVTRKIIIGLAGPEGVGKSTVADAIVQRAATLTQFHGVGYRASFAAPLYDALSAICKVSVEHIKKRKDEIFTAETAPVPCLVGLSYRAMLQKLGEEFGRKQCHPEFWAQLAVAREKVWNGKVNFIVFDDVRYENEAAQCHLVCELQRDGIDYARTHASNMGLPGHVRKAVIRMEEGGAHHVAEHLIKSAINMNFGAVVR